MINCKYRNQLNPTSHWEEIDFTSVGEYDRFCKYLERQIAEGIAEEIPEDPNYGLGEVYGGRWYRDLDSGEIWRLFEPDGPWGGTFERFEL